MAIGLQGTFYERIPVRLDAGPLHREHFLYFFVPAQAAETVAAEEESITRCQLPAQVICLCNGRDITQAPGDDIAIGMINGQFRIQFSAVYELLDIGMVLGQTDKSGLPVKKVSPGVTAPGYVCSAPEQPA